MPKPTNAPNAMFTVEESRSVDKRKVPPLQVNWNKNVWPTRTNASFPVAKPTNSTEKRHSIPFDQKALVLLLSANALPILPNSDDLQFRRFLSDPYPNQPIRHKKGTVFPLLRTLLSYYFQQMHHQSFQTQTTCSFAPYNRKKCDVHSRRKQIRWQKTKVLPA